MKTNRVSLFSVATKSNSGYINATSRFNYISATLGHIMRNIAALTALLFVFIGKIQEYIRKRLTSDMDSLRWSQDCHIVSGSRCRLVAVIPSKVIATLMLIFIVGVGNVWGATSTLTFTKACGGSGTADDNASWEVTSDATESTYDGTKGIHYGTGSVAVSYINLTTSSISGTITKIKVNASGASGTSAKLDVTVGESAFGSQQSLTSTATDYTLTGSASGTIVVAITQSSTKKAMYCKSIEVTYSTGGGDVAVTSVSLKSSTSIEATKTETLIATILPADATNKNITWTTSNSSVATVSDAGVVTAIAVGTATITATSDADNTKSASCIVTVTAHTITAGTYNIVPNNTFFNTEANGSISGDAANITYTGTQDDITITYAKGSQSNMYINASQTRAYNGSIMTFSVPDGYVITAIVFTADGNNWAGTHTADVGSMTDNKNWSGSSKEVAITFGGTCRITSISVTFAAGSSISAPTFSVAADSYCETQSVTLSCATGGASIYYTTNGTTPTSSSTLYSSAISVSSTTTIKAIAIKGSDESAVASATYTINNIANTQATAYSVAEAIALIDAGTCISEQEVYVEGYVSEIVTEYNSTYGNITFNISANGLTSGDQFQFYRNFKAAGKTKWTSASEAPQVGNHVIGYGTLAKYGSTYEFAEGNYCVANEAIALPTYTVTLETGEGTVSASGWTDNGSGNYTKTQSTGGEAITLPTPALSAACDAIGYEFAGWKANTALSDDTNEEPELQAAGSYTPTANITFYAVYKITEGEGAKSTTISISDYATANSWTNGTKYTTITVNPITLTATGGSNTGKYYTSDNTWRIYSSESATVSISVEGGTVTSVTSTPSCDFTITSGEATCTPSSQTNFKSFEINYSAGINTWTCNPDCSGTATVTYDANGATSGTAPVDANSPYERGATVTVLGNSGSLAKTDMDFAGWNTKADGSGTTYTEGTTFKIKKNTTLYAKWIVGCTITLIDNGKTTTILWEKDTKYTLPEEGESTCEDATFLGWATGEYSNHLTGTASTPSYDAGGTEKTISADVTFVAVYGTLVPDASNEYSLITSAAELQTGDYLVVCSLDYAMGNTVSSSHMSESSVTPSSDKITSTNTAIRWHITKTGDNYTFYNAAANKYLALSTESPLLQATEHNFTATYSSDAWVFESTTVADYQLVYDYYFISATAQESNIYLYRRGSGIGNWTSKPRCCAPPTKALTISSDATNLVGSGVAHLTLNTEDGGGNGKNIVWTTTGGTLSNKTNTGATLSLPTASTTQVYTVTATQAENDDDEDNLLCGTVVNVNITVKAEFTITLITKNNGTESTYETYTVADGNTYTLPDISDEYTCSTGHSFAGWVDNLSHTSIDGATGSTQTATADKTWYAAWSTGSTTKSLTLYEKVTDVSSLTSGSIVLIAATDDNYAMAEQKDNNRAQAAIIKNPDNENQVYFNESSGVVEFTIGKSGTYYTFSDGSQYLYAASSSSNHLKSQTTLTNDGKWDISITDGKAEVTAQGSYTRNLMRYNKSSNLFSCYASGQQDISLYKKTTATISIEVANSGVSANNTWCTTGPMIRATDGQWVTSAKGQTVKKEISVLAKNFAAAETLEVASNNDKFAVSLAATAIPKGRTGLTTTLIVEYTPTEANVKESATITFTAGEATKTITVNGRSLPDEFVIATKKAIWYALPANMKGAGQYNGIAITPDDAESPTLVPVTSSTEVYSLRGVASDRYDTYGKNVRLVGSGGKCLWANNTANNTYIQNTSQLINATSGNYEWLLTTSDGDRYTIANTAHPDYGSGRVLGYGSQFGLLKGEYYFYILPVGCSSQPGNLQVSPRRVEVIFSWESNASSLLIEITPKGGGTTISKTVTSSPAYVSGLTEQTEYEFTVTPYDSNGDASTDCQVSGEFSTTGPTIDVMEWEENAVIVQVDKDPSLDPYIFIQGEAESGVEGQAATDLFFAKYFEGAGSMKLLSIFNGTRNDINLSDYSIYLKCVSNSTNTFSPSSDKEFPLASLGSIASGQEIIFFTEPTSGESPYSCTSTFLTEMSLLSGEENNPRWINCDNKTYYNGTKFSKMDFSGNDPLLLKKGSTIIDVFGAKDTPPTTKDCRNADIGWWGEVKNMDYGKEVDDPSFDALYTASSKTPTTDSEKKAVLNGFGIDLDNEVIDICSARCILFRAKVTSGADAVTNNTTTFATFTPEEWNGRSVCMDNAMRTAAGVSDDGESTCNSYQDLGKFDYNSYYKEFQSIDNKRLEDFYIGRNEYRVPITDMKQYACLNLKFILTEDEEGNNVLTEQTQQVPIVIANAKTTADALFHKVIVSDAEDYSESLITQSIERCADCNVVVLKDATLTKAADGTTYDVATVRDLKVYEGGKLIVPTGTTYNVNSLALRRQEDEISIANIQGTLNVTEAKGAYLDLLIDPSNWHYMALPYNCNIDEVAFSNGIPAAQNTDYLLRWYDGEYRAEHKDGGWTDVDAGSTLKKGLGYIAALPGSGSVRRELRFPMSKDVITDDKQNKDVGELYAYGCNDTELRPNHKGWNMIGNPYLTYYNASALADPLIMGTLELEVNETTGKYTGYWNLNTDGGKNLRYLVVPVNNGWSEYQQEVITNFTALEPFTGYFVQVGGSDPELAQGVQFKSDKVNRSIIARTKQEDNLRPVWFGINLTNEKNETDATALLISDQFTDCYDIMDDLIKMRGTYYKYYTKPVIASRNNEGEMAFNAVPDATAATGIPLNYFAAANGEYNISVDPRYDLTNIEEAWLHDSQEEIWHNLLLEDYEFTSTKGDNTARFSLIVKVKRKPTIATDTDSPFTNNSIDDVCIYSGDNILTLRNLPTDSQIWIYTMDGKLLRHSSNTPTLTVTLPNGIYNIRIETHEGSRTLKGIVK